MYNIKRGLLSPFYICVFVISPIPAGLVNEVIEQSLTSLASNSGLEPDDCLKQIRSIKMGQPDKKYPAEHVVRLRRLPGGDIPVC